MIEVESVDMFYRYAALGLLLVISAANDIRSYKINNITVAAGLGAGLILNLLSGGLSGLVSSVLAAVIPAILLIVLFALRMLGAGDIKLFCAIGAIMGIPFIFYAMAYSFLAGGLMALAVMLARGNMKERLRYISTYLKTCFLTGKFTPYTEFGDKSDGAKFHFSLAIAAGSMIQTFITIHHALLLTMI